MFSWFRAPLGVNGTTAHRSGPAIVPRDERPSARTSATGNQSRCRKLCSARSSPWCREGLRLIRHLVRSRLFGLFGLIFATSLIYDQHISGPVCRGSAVVPHCAGCRATRCRRCPHLPWCYGLRGGSYARPSADLASRLWDPLSPVTCPSISKHGCSGRGLGRCTGRGWQPSLAAWRSPRLLLHGRRSSHAVRRKTDLLLSESLLADGCGGLEPRGAA